MSSSPQPSSPHAHLKEHSPHSSSAHTHEQARSGWGADLSAGFTVALIALPLCLGIAAASGFPPVAGVLSAIIGGVLGAFTGSAPLTIKGPAAGLIVIALGAVTELGYQATLAVGVVAALLQLLFALTKAGRFALIMPPSVIHGMMAAIGLIIMIKQLPIALGVVGAQGSPLQALSKLPEILLGAHPVALVTALLTLLVLTLWPHVKGPLSRLPAPLVALFVALPISLYTDLAHPHHLLFMGQEADVGPELLVSLPHDFLGAITTPDFSKIFIGASINYIIAFALIGAVESLLSVLAVDQLDPRKQASDLNRDLRSTALINLVTASIGGLPVISEIVRSKANVSAGAQSGKANAAHGVALLIFLVLLPEVLHLIPLAALAAMLLKVGGQLAHPRALLHMKREGAEQLTIFVTTALVTLIEDLLVGVGIGLVLKVIFALMKGVSFKNLARCELTREERGEELHITISGSLAFTHALAISDAFKGVAEGSWRLVTLDVSGCSVVDSAVMLRVKQLSGEWPHSELNLIGAELPHEHH